MSEDWQPRRVSDDDLGLILFEVGGEYPANGTAAKLATDLRYERDVVKQLEYEKLVLLRALQGLTSHTYISLGDLVYGVREREGLGWDGSLWSAWLAGRVSTSPDTITISREDASICHNNLARCLDALDSEEMATFDRLSQALARRS